VCVCACVCVCVCVRVRVKRKEKLEQKTMNKSRLQCKGWHVLSFLNWVERERRGERERERDSEEWV
jgi:hypothetical protein